MKSPDNAAITEVLTQPFPLEIIEQKNGLSFVPHEYVRERVMVATANTFDWTIDQILFRDDGVTRRSANRQTGETPRPHSMIVIGTLTVPGLGSRAGIGAHPLDEGSGEDAAYKSAESDAFKRAAMAFGVGLRQLYIEKGQTAAAPAPRPRARTAEANPPSAISDKVFGDQVRQAAADRDGAAFRHLSSVAGRNAARWRMLIHAAESEPALDWIVRQMDRQNALSPQLEDEIARQRETLAA
jgi:hypothetical protein